MDGQTNGYGKVVVVGVASHDITVYYMMSCE